MINVAVMGYGTVGSGVVEVLRTNGELINERAQDVINVKYVLDLRDFPGDPVEEILTHDFETIVNAGTFTRLPSMSASAFSRVLANPS